MALDTKARLSMNAAGAATQQQVDVGLRNYMLKVYNYMGSALALSGVVAFFVATNQSLQQVIFGTGLMWLFVLAPLGLVFFLSAKIQTMKASTAQTVFWVFAGMMGISLSTILLQTWKTLAPTVTVPAQCATNRRKLGRHQLGQRQKRAKRHGLESNRLSSEPSECGRRGAIFGGACARQPAHHWTAWPETRCRCRCGTPPLGKQR